MNTPILLLLTVGPYVVIGLTALCLIHMFRNKRDKTWAVLLLLMPAIGAAIYFAAEVLPSWFKHNTSRN